MRRLLQVRVSQQTIGRDTSEDLQQPRGKHWRWQSRQDLWQMSCEGGDQGKDGTSLGDHLCHDVGQELETAPPPAKESFSCKCLR